MDPTALADALDELDGALAHLRKQHARLVQEKPWMTRDLQTVRAALAELAERHAALVATGATLSPRALAEVASSVLALEARLMKMESTGLPRWQK